VGLAWLGRQLGSPQAGHPGGFLYVAAPSRSSTTGMALVDSLLAALVIYALASRAVGADRAPALGGRPRRRRGGGRLTKLSGLLTLVASRRAGLLLPRRDRARLRAQLAWVYGIALVLLIPSSWTGRATAFLSENLWVLRSGEDGPRSSGRNARLAANGSSPTSHRSAHVLVSAAAAWSCAAVSRADLLLLGVARGLVRVLRGGGWALLVPALHPARHPAAPSPAGPRGRGPGPGRGVADGWPARGAWFRFDAALIADPVRAPLPPVERSQYIYDWPSGYGLAEVVRHCGGPRARGPSRSCATDPPRR
jgi:hypothetical protein